MRRLHVHNCAPLTIRSPSRGIATDAISAENLYAFGAKHVTKGLGRITEGIMTKGEGSYVVYDDGRRMLDFTCGIGVTSLGKLYFLDDVEVAWGCGGSNGFKIFRPFLDGPYCPFTTRSLSMLTVRMLGKTRYF